MQVKISSNVHNPYVSLYDDNNNFILGILPATILSIYRESFESYDWLVGLSNGTIVGPLTQEEAAQLDRLVRRFSSGELVDKPT